jgi:hypothetical protein
VKDFFGYWLNRGNWDSKNAALILNCKDPRVWEKKIAFPSDINDFSRVKPDTWQWKVIEYYSIFESTTSADWEKHGADIDHPYFWFRTYKEARPRVFISLALDKRLEIPDELLRIQEEKISHVHKPEEARDKTIGERRVDILKIWLESNNPEGKPIEKTRLEVWGELFGIDEEAFPARSQHTINDFFKSQNCCEFKPGRRKEG